MRLGEGNKNCCPDLKPPPAALPGLVYLRPWFRRELNLLEIRWCFVCPVCRSLWSPFFTSVILYFLRDLDTYVFFSPSWISASRLFDSSPFHPFDPCVLSPQTRWSQRGRFFIYFSLIPGVLVFSPLTRLLLSHLTPVAIKGKVWGDYRAGVIRPVIWTKLTWSDPGWIIWRFRAVSGSSAVNKWVIK